MVGEVVGEIVRDVVGRVVGVMVGSMGGVVSKGLVGFALDAPYKTTVESVSTELSHFNAMFSIYSKFCCFETDHTVTLCSDSDGIQ